MKHLDDETPAELLTSDVLALPVPPWWQTGTTDEFVGRMRALPLQDAQVTSSEISAAIASITAQLASSMASDLNWKRRATSAKYFAIARKQLAKKVIAERHNEARVINNGRRQAFVDSARECLEEGDLKECLAIVLDLLDPRESDRADPKENERVP